MYGASYGNYFSALTNYGGGRRRGFKRRRFSYRGVGGKLRGLMQRTRYLSKLIERKFFNNPYSATASSTVLYNIMSGIPNGTGQSERVGRQIMVHALRFKLYVAMAAAATITWVRWIIFVDHQYNGTAPTNFTDIFDAANQTAMVKILNRDRYSLLFDRLYNLDLISQNTMIDKGIKKWPKGLRLDYTGTGSATTDSGKNAIWVVTLSNEATNVPSINATVRLKYCDA